MTDFVSLETLDKLLEEGKISSAEYEEQKRILFRRTLRESGERENPKNGLIYILLAFFLGTIGVHNFYAGFLKRGLIQLFLTVMSPLFLFLPLMFTSVWALLELLFKNTSSDGHIMSGNRKAIWGLRIVVIAVLVFVGLHTEYTDMSLPIEEINEDDLSVVSEIMDS